MGPDPGERGLGGLLHNVSELTGDRQFARARDSGRLDEEDLAPNRRPGEAGRHPWILGAPALLREEAPLAEQLTGALCRDPHLALGLALGDLTRDLAADRPDLSLEVADARLARVLVDDRRQRGVGEFDL